MCHSISFLNGVIFRKAAYGYVGSEVGLKKSIREELRKKEREKEEDNRKKLLHYFENVSKSNDLIKLINMINDKTIAILKNDNQLFLLFHQIVIKYFGEFAANDTSIARKFLEKTDVLYLRSFYSFLLLKKVIINERQQCWKILKLNEQFEILFGKINVVEDFTKNKIYKNILRYVSDYKKDTHDKNIFLLFHHKLNKHFSELLKCNFLIATSILRNVNFIYKTFNNNKKSKNVIKEYNEMLELWKEEYIKRYGKKKKKSQAQKTSNISSEVDFSKGNFEVYIPEKNDKNICENITQAKKRTGLLIRLVEILLGHYYRQVVISKTVFPSNDSFSEIIELPDSLKYFEQKAILDIVARRIGIPGGEWYCSINSKVLNKAGFWYFNIREKKGIISARVWTNKGTVIIQLSPISFENVYNQWSRMLVTYLLCALADLVSFRFSRARKSPALPKDRSNYRNSFRNLKVYKPRIRHNADNKPNTNTGKPYSKKQPFTVSWHLRRMRMGGNAGADAREKALKYAGIPWNNWDTVWKGLTFVSPHIRGGKEYDKNRSYKKIIVNQLTDSFSLTIDNLFSSNN